MDMPLASIERIEIDNATARQSAALAVIVLSKTPTFYIESFVGGGKRVWAECADYTEGMQASHTLRHELIGPDSQLQRVLGRFPYTRDTYQQPAPASSIPGEVDIVDG